MKHLFRRLLAALLALTLTATPALASQALGWELTRSETVVGPGATVTTQKLWGDSKSDYRTEQFFTYTPGQGVSPVVAYGAVVPEKLTLSAMAKGLESYGGRVLAGANGDYFVVATGVPLGMVVTWGVLRSSSSYHYAVGFDADGKAIIGKPELTVWADIKGQHLAVMGGYNKTRVAGDGLTLFSRDFGSATKGSGAGINVVLRPATFPADYAPPAYVPPAAPTAPTAPVVDANGAATDPVTGAPVDLAVYQAELAAYQAALEEYNRALAAYETEYNAALAASVGAFPTAPAQLIIGGDKVDCVVEQVVDLAGGITIPEGCFLLTVDKESAEFFQTQLSTLRVGERVTLSVTSPDERWNSVEQAMGGYMLLLKDGVVQEGLDNTANPRTALGVKENGQVILYTIDGRQSGYSVGASMRQVAARLKELGCVDAVLFDGGGSTTFGGTAPLDSAFTLQNKPSDGGQRAVSNALFFVSNLKKTGELGSLYVTPQSGLLLPGGRVTLGAQGIDSGYYPMGSTVPDVSYTVSGPGTVAGNVFTASATAEKAEAIVTAAAADGSQGQTVLTVIDTPHTITLANSATNQTVSTLNLDPGQSVPLVASATWYGLPVTASNESFTWALSPNLGTVNPLGTLTSGEKAGAGTLTVTAGSKSVSIPVTVAGHVTPMEEFEGGECQFRAVSGGLAKLSGEKVKYGFQAMEIVRQGSETVLETYMGLNEGEMDVSFWVYSQEECSLEVLFLLKDGTEKAVSAVTQPAAGGWSFVQAALPDGADAVSGLRVRNRQDPSKNSQEPSKNSQDTSAGIQESSGSVLKPSVFVDQWCSTNGGLRDETPPTVQVQYNQAENGPVTAKVSDNVDKVFDAARIEVTVDGKWVPFDLNGGTVTANVSLNDGHTHRVSVTVTDCSGNIGRGSVQIDHPADMPTPPSGTTPYVYPFDDISGHWAADYADYLYDQGVTNGSPGAGGTLLFQPGANITRGDFVTMLCRWMGLDLSKYANVVLPFVDAATIQPWAVDAIKAAYDLGIFTGSAEVSGLYANANQSITRAQAMTLLGRVRPKGYATAGDAFLDQADIPAWAAEHVSALVAQGIVNGYGGYVRPQDPITRAEVAKVLSVMW